MINFNKLKKKGQISFEYIVLIGGIIVFTLIVLTVVRNVLNQNTSSITGTRSVILNKTCNPTSDTDPISLVSYYRFDETTGNFARDASKNSYDLTGLLHSYGGSGKLGGSIMAATQANSSVSTKITFTGPFTIEFYIKIADSNLLFPNFRLALSNNVLLNYSKGNITIYQTNNIGVNYTVNITLESSFVFNDWNHVAITYDTSIYNSYVNLNWFNGTADTTTPRVPVRPGTDVSDSYINLISLNITSTANTIFFDELKVYNRALTIAEITNDATCVK